MSSALTPGFKDLVHHPSFTPYIPQTVSYNQDISSACYSKASLSSSTP
ncbi:MAG: hypothetical protein OXB86_01070 [Bdellovibrionales bacterium]|nr:hypothetical protein [Bdellovibrionales bacterium]